MSPTPDNPSTILGARASTAGDVFHELWALRAALGLINPHTELKAVTVEGIAAPAGSTHLYDGVDCGLLYGDTSLELASRIEFVQLKYSTASPNAAWTVARLTANSAKKNNNSVIRKLATDFAKAQGAIAPSATLVTKLVSNQPLAPEVADAIAKIRNGDHSDPNAYKIVAASELSGPQLLAFLDALDFSDMGSESRSALQDAIAQEVSELSADEADTLVLQMQSRIRKLMLPEATREIISGSTVLSWFGISTLSALFPAPADFQPMVEPIIQRSPATKVRDELLAGNLLLCIHGLGGCGKTTTMRQVQSLLPAGSVCVLYDCYGAGRYSHSNDRRHLPENAFLQIINDLAMQQGVPLLLAKQSSQMVNIRTFIERIKKSAELLEKASPSGLLTILIDAADNSVTAAEHDPTASACFIWEIANADLRELPANVRFVMSSRTGRKDRLQLPSKTKYIECPPFTRTETRAYVDACLPGLPDDWLDQFGALSNGIARVQAYAFKKGGTSSNDVLNALRPSGKGLDSVLQELFQDAAKKGGQNFYERCVTTIDTLPGPIPLTHFASICGTTDAIVRDFISDVSPTLRIENDTVTIADEDVEDFLASEGHSRHTQTLTEACNYFQTIYRTDTYAATHYCDLLSEAGRASDILPLIQKDVVPEGISDPIVQREVQVRRLRLALAACRAEGNAADILKTILLSAEAAKDEAALRQLLEREAELSVRFARDSLFRLVLSDRDTYSRQGSILVHDSLRAALEGDKITANEQLHLYQHWMRRRKEAESDHDWKLPHEDYVALAQAITVLRGAKHFVERNRDWSPASFRLHVALDLISQLVSCSRREIVEIAYAEQLVPKRWNLILTVPLALSGYAIQKERLEAELASLRRRFVPDLRNVHSHSGETWKFKYLEIIVTACEIGYALRIDRNILQRVLALVLDHRTSPSSSIHYADASKIDIALRAWLLRRELTPKTEEELNNEATNLAKTPETGKRSGTPVKYPDSEQFMSFALYKNAPPKKKQPGRKKEPTRVERDTTDESLKRVLDGIYHIYAARITALAEATKAPIKDKPATDLTLGIDSYTFDREYYGSEFRTKAAQSVARLSHLDGLSPEYLFECTASILRSRQDGPIANRSLPVWQDFLVRPEVHQKILDEIMTRSKALKLARISAQDKTNALLDFSKLVLNFSPKDAQALFEDAVVVAQEVDREAMIQIDFVASLTTRHDDFSPVLRRELAVAHAAYVTDVAIRLDGEEYFPWSKAISAIYDLSPEVALAALSQWQDEGITGLDDTLGPLLRRIAKDGENPVLASALFGLLKHIPERGFLTLIDCVRANADPARKDAFDLLSKKLLMDVFQSQRATLIEELAKRLPRDFKPGDMTSRLQAEAGIPNLGSETKYSESKTEPATRVVFPDTANFSTGAGIRAAIEAAIAEERTQSRYTSLDAILLSARERITTPAQRPMFLDVVSEFKGDGLDADDLSSVILDTLAAWKGPALESWKNQHLPIIIRRNLWGLTRWLRESNNRVQNLIQASGLQGHALIDVIASGIEECSDKYSSGALFGLCEIMAPSLTKEDANKLTKWYIDRLGEKVPQDVVARFHLTEMPEDFDQAIGRFLFSQFSDIDLRVRWRAAHCLRSITALQGGWALKSVLDAYNQKTDGAFRIKDAPFYWLGARLFSMMTTARIALERPEAITSLAPMLFAIATDNELPHYLIRSYSKEAIEALLAHDPTLLSAGEKQALADVNRPKVKQKPRKKDTYYRELEHAKRKGERFGFNSMDTIPYWYSPLYRHFADLTPENFYVTLERWLIDVWKADRESNWWDKEPRRKRYDSDSMASYHGHGSQPTIERYGTYLEWHAMFCGLGEWIETEPLVAPEHDSDSLKYWLRRWKPTEAPTWLADRRSHRPLDKEFIVDNVGDDKHWLRRVSKHRFQAAICGGANATPGVMTICGDWSISGKSRQIDVDVNTALVDPASASALIRTLSIKENRFWLPTEHEERDDGESYKVPPFRLYGWLSRAGSDTEYDQDDPLRAEVSELKIKPAASLVSKYKLTEKGLPVSLWMNCTTQEWFRYETWSDWNGKDFQRRVHLRPIGSNGYRLLVRKDALLTIMKNENLDLIANIEIERRLESEYGEPSKWDDETRRRTSRKILVFRQNGEIEDEAGCIGTWR